MPRSPIDHWHLFWTYKCRRKFATVESVCFLTLLLREFLKERLRLRLVWLMFLLDLLGERRAREYRGYLRKCNLYIVKIGDLLPLANNPYYRIGLGLEVWTVVPIALSLQCEKKNTFSAKSRGLGRSRARPSRGRGFGLAQLLRKPEPSQAGPKPRLSGQAGPEHHYLWGLFGRDEPFYQFHFDV